PEVITVLAQGGDAVDLKLPGGDTWRFSAGGKTIAIERSTFVADPSGPAISEQIVLRGLCGGVAELNWKLDKVQPAA
ncbi:hypothetical protein ABTF44_23100, partial [Acinetobacter baumannii]